MGRLTVRQLPYISLNLMASLVEGGALISFDVRSGRLHTTCTRTNANLTRQLMSSLL